MSVHDQHGQGDAERAQAEEEVGDAGAGAAGSAPPSAGERGTPGPPTKPADASPWLIRPAPIEWICLAAGLYFVFHYFWFMDDAFVYYRYADNLLFLGFGLVHNAGEYVEGYSSPLWMLLMLALRTLRLSWWAIVGGLAVTGFVAFWVQTIILNRRLSPRREFVVNFPLVFLTFNYAAASFFTSGLETPLILAIAVSYALFIVTPGILALELLVALSPLIRPELALPMVLAVIWSAWLRRRVPWRLLLMAALGGGGWLVFRVWYYADFFPNTFYLKNVVSVSQGIAYVHDTLLPYHGYTLFAIFAVVLAALHRRSDFRHRMRLPQRLFMLVVAGSVAAYVVKIGGDALHFRHLIFPFTLAVCASAGLIEELFERVMRLEHVGRLTVKPVRLLEGLLLGIIGAVGFVLAYVWGIYVLMAPTAACVVGGLMLAGPPRVRPMAIAIGSIVAALAFFSYPRQLATHPWALESEHRPIMQISDVQAYREIEGLEPREQLDAYAEFLRLGGDYPRAVAGDWCAQNYQLFYLRIVHALGLTDPFLARIVMASDAPAHKLGLRPMAADIADIYNRYGIGKGVFEAAVADGAAPEWVADNFDSIATIERKVFNEHRFGENLRLAFTRVEPIVPRQEDLGTKDASPPPAERGLALPEAEAER